MAADVESLITIAASIIMGNQVSTPDATAQRVRIITAVETAKQIHNEVQRVLDPRKAQSKAAVKDN